MRLPSTNALVAVALLSLLVSCKKDRPGGSGSGAPGVPLVVTVLGTENDSVMIWKNGKSSPIYSQSDVLFNFGVSSLAAIANNIYIAGFELANNSAVYPYAPAYWLNGAATALPDTTGAAGNGVANAVAVSGSDVYFAGVRDYFSDSSSVAFTNDSASYPISGQIATIWKNGTPVSLPNFGSVGILTQPDFVNRFRNDYVTGMCISGSDVYVSGGTTWDVSAHACYWKNGVAVDLGNNLIYTAPNNSEGYPQTTSIYVYDKDVYVTGCQQTTLGATVALYWKNGSPVFLSNDSAAGSAAYSAAVSGSDLYVAGYQNVGAYSRATIWKNGAPTALTGSDTASFATAVMAVNGDVYVAGYTWQQFGHYVATYWKNGVAVPLTDGSNNAMAYSISVE
jgi:hypothetical protein